MPFIDEARKAGYSEDEIQAYLAPKVAAAQTEGYSPEEIGKYVGIKPINHEAAQKSLASKVYDSLASFAKDRVVGIVKGAKDTIGAYEAYANTATGMVAGFPAYLIGGVGGLAARYTYSPDTDPKEIATKFAEAVTYDPRSDSGKEQAATLQYPMHLLSAFKEKMGKKVADATGSPVLAAITDETIGMLPAVVLGALGRTLKGDAPTNSTIYETAKGLAPDAPYSVTKALSDKVQTVYEKTGVDPQTLKEHAIQDPTVMADLASSNKTPFADASKPAEPKAAPVKIPAEPGTPAAAQEAVLARISTDAPVKAQPTIDGMYTALKDDLYPIAKIEEKLTGGISLDTAESPYRLARLVRGAAGKATQFLDYSTFDFNTLKDTGPGLKTILEPFNKDLEGLRAYLVSRRAEELHARGIKTGIPADAAATVIKNGKQYEATAKQLYAYQDSITNYMKDAGLLSDEAYTAMRELNKDYVPFHRLFEGEGATGGTGAGLTTRNPIRAIKGSERVVLDPLESIIKNTYIYTALAEKNAVGRALGDVVAKNPEAAKSLGISKVKPKVKPITLNESEIRKIFDEFVTTSKKTSTKRTESVSTSGVEGGAAESTSKVFTSNKQRVMDALTARGFSENEAEIMVKRLGNPNAKGGETVDRLVKEVTQTEVVPELNIRLPNDAATIFRPNAMRPEPNQIRYYEGGKPVTLEVPRDVADAFNATDRQSVGMLMKILAAPAKTLRAGAILTPDFMARNVMRDQLSAFSFSTSGYIPVWDMVKGAMSIAKKDGDFQNWLKSGGPNSAMVSLDREYLQQHLSALDKDTGLMQRSWNVVRSPLEVLRITSEFMENATRLGEFKRNLGKQTDKGAIQEAGFQSREVTLDFQRIGAQTRSLNMIAAFMNAGVEGLDRTVRAFKDAPMATTAKVTAAITMPSVLLWYANNSTPERQARWREIPNWQRDLFWIVMTDEHTYRIPKPFELGVIFGSLPERMLDKYAADRPEAMKDFMKSVGSMASVNVMPTGAVPLLEQATNHSFFTGNPLIPRRMEGILPEYQYQEYTTQLSRAVGRIVGAFPGLHDKSIASPLVIDNYIHQWTGGLGVYATQGLDAGLRKAGVLPDPPTPLATLADIPVIKAFMVRYPTAAAQSVQDFYEKYNQRKTVYDTFQYLVKNGDAEAAKKEALLDPGAFARLDGVQQTLSTLNTNIRMVYRNPEMSPSDKRQLIDSMYGQMIELTRAGNKAMADVDAALK